LRTVVLGDIHLGSPLCRAELLRGVLESAKFDRLVLNGDVFDDLNFRRLRSEHWAVMQAVRDLADRREVIWIRGNHDGSAEVLRHLLGIPVLDEFLFDFRGQRVLVVHGDTFDDFQKAAPSLKQLRHVFYGFAIWFDVPRKTAIQWAQRSTSVFVRAVDKVKRKTVQAARERGARFVVVGHTHHREREEHDGVLYLNPSSWLTANPAYVLFDDSEPEPQMVTLHAGRRHGALRRSLRGLTHRSRTS